MSHGDTCMRAAARLHRHGQHAEARRLRPPRIPPAAVRDAVPSRGRAHRARHGDAPRNSWPRPGCRADWTMRNIIDEQAELIRAQVGDGRAICGLSGGVDSAVAAALVQRAIGHAADLRLRRSRAAAQGRGRAGRAGLRGRYRRRARGRGRPDRFAAALAGVTDPEGKRKIIGREFIRAFEQAARQIATRDAHDRAARPSSWCRARSTPTSSSPAAEPGRPTSSRTTTSAGCPRTSAST